MKQMRSSIFAVFILLALPSLAEDTANDIYSEGSEASGSAGIISVIANMNTSGNQTIQDVTEWIYIMRDENWNCTGHFGPLLEENFTIGVMNCPEDLMAIDENEINFKKAVEVILKSSSNETAYERIFLAKLLNSAEPIWSFVTRDGDTILIGANSGEILSRSPEIKADREAKPRLLGASRGGISDVMDSIIDLEYYICVDACIAGCHSLPSDIYSPGYTLDDCISECPEDCKN